MQSPSQQLRRYRFGPFEIDLSEGVLRRQGLKIKLNDKPFQVLALLLERAGHLVTREDVRQRLWPADTYVDFDTNVNRALSTLRHTLDDSYDNPVFIETVPRQGYRFIAPVKTIEENSRRRFVNPFLIAVSAIVLISVLVWTAQIHRTHKAKASGIVRDKVTILVIPFENLSGDPEQEYLSDGLTDEMITRLGQISPAHVNVTARSTAMRYKHTQKTVEQIAEERNLDYILEGSLRRQSDRIHITAQLFKAGEQGSLWTEAYDRDANDLLVIQREVADRIAHSLSLEVLPAARTDGIPPNPDAYDDYLKGLFELNKRTRGDLRRSIASFRQAVAKDPKFAPALTALASSYNVAGGWAFLSPAEAYPNAKQAVQRALVLDDSLADAHAVYGEVLHEYEWDWVGAEREYQRALELNPSSADAHKLYGEYLTHAGRYTEALLEIRKAQQLDPASLVMNAFVCFVYYHVREYDKAIRECDKVVELDSGFMPAHYWRGASEVFAGRYEDAIADFRRASELSENGTYFLTWAAFAFALEGRKQKAQEILEKLKHNARQVYVSPYGVASVYIALGDRGQAIAMLEKAYQERSADLVFLATAPEFDVLRSDPQFQRMIARIDFPNSALAYGVGRQASSKPIALHLRGGASR
jgi:TolB-like protein/DNA-binding winged helix-turn-helix (wHTH) protein/Flp pilus assembly protein TadD